MEPFFFKKHSFFIMISIFSKFENFLILANKTSQLRWKRRFLEIISFDAHYIANLPPLAILKKIQNFLRKTYLFLSKITQILNVSRNLDISVASIQRLICYNLAKNIFQWQKVSEVGHYQSASHRFEKGRV